ncbi:MAG: UbiA family prenyltransferase [Thermodesulfobacteriota bacterium]|nr:UbiA family prenyltransferase [Thermodesulfobacteriota bacterium]
MRPRVKQLSIYKIYADMGKLKDLLELIRIPNIFTAQADIFTGFFVAHGGLKDTGNLICLIIASSMLYSAGMALNDAFDSETDFQERRYRPIPSGRVSIREAFITGIALLLLGIFFASLVSPSSFTIAMILAVSILSYDGVVKVHRLFGPMNMGGCRYLNLLLGLSVSALSLTSFILPLLTGIFIFGVTVLSQWETRDERSVIPVCLCLGSIGCVFILYGLCHQLDLLPQKIGLLLCFLWLIFSSLCLFRLLKRDSNTDIQETVKALILSLVLLDGIIVAGSGPIFWTFLIWSLLFPTLFLSRKFYVT